MLDYQDYTQDPKSVDFEHPNQFSSEEFDLLARIAMDGARIATIMCDREYAPDFKRKLIYYQMVQIVQNIGNWETKTKQNRNDDDLTYIFGDSTIKGDSNE